MGLPPGAVPENGGRVRAPAPTELREPSAYFVGAGHWPARGRTLCAPTVETICPHNQDRSPHPSGLMAGPLPLVPSGHFPLTGGIGLPTGEGLGQTKGWVTTADLAPGTAVGKTQAQNGIPQSPPNGGDSPLLQGGLAGLGRGGPLGPPAGIRTSSIGSANPGAILEPHQRQIFAHSGPQWARMETLASTPGFARRKFC